MEFLFRDRGSGKRQVKPSQEITLLEDQLAGGESSDDEDFTLPEKGKNSVENSDNASSGTTIQFFSPVDFNTLRVDCPCNLRAVC